MFGQVLRATPRPLLFVSAISAGAAFFATSFPDAPGTSAGSYVSTSLMALPAFYALFRYLGVRRASFSLLALAAFAYAIETVGTTTGLPYGRFYYGDALGAKLFGVVPYLLPVSYIPLVIGAFAAAWRPGRSSRAGLVFRSAALLVLIDGVLDPGAVVLGLWAWPEGGLYYGVPLSNYAGWLLSGGLAAALLLAAGRPRGAPPPGAVDSVVLALAFWTGAAVLSGLLFPALLGAALFVFFLYRRRELRGEPAGKAAPPGSRV